jgi:[ribosomal protein S5]-alanine N-acetyltransferase
MQNAKIDLTGVALETERLLLRPFEEKDLDDFYEYARVPGVGEWAGWPHHESKEESARILKMFMEDKKTFAIVFKAENRVVGSLGLENYKWDLQGFRSDLVGREIGYVLSKDYWGNGLMSEAVKRVIAFCFNDLHLDFLVISHWTKNDRSRRVIEKCGFHFLGEGEYTTIMDEVRPIKKYILFNPANKIAL